MSSADPLPTSVLVVSAVYNNAATVGELHRRLEAATHRAGLEARFLYVDDGSLDDSWSIIRRLAATHRTVAGIRLAGNFGQTRALCAGLESARADVVVYIDADLEVPPEAVELLAPEIFAGHDFVGGARSPRDRHAVRRAGARAFNALTRILTGLDVQDVGCGLVAMGPNVVDAVIDAMRNRPVQIIKPTMMFAATDPIEVRIPSVSPQNSSHTKRMLIRFAIEFLALEATVSASERAGRREGSTGRASRSARIVHAAMRAVAAAVPPVKRSGLEAIGALYAVDGRVGWVAVDAPPPAALRP